MIKGIFETHINVSDVERSAAFYERLPGITLLHEDTARKSRFYWVGAPGVSMLGIRENYPTPLVQRQHFAFRVELEDLRSAHEELSRLGISTENFHGEDAAQLMVFPFMPAVSIYFDDPDGHSIEYLAMLDDEPRPDLPIMSWQEWDQLHNRTES